MRLLRDKHTWKGKLAYTGFLLLAMTGLSWAGYKTGADFLKIPIGARPVGLGQAATALSLGIDSLNWNPAGIAHHNSLPSQPTLGLGFSHQNLFLDTQLDNLGLILPSKNQNLSLGFSMTRIAYPSQDGRDENRNEQSSFGASDLAVGTALGINWGAAQMGLHLKFIRQELSDVQAQGMAVDLGLLSMTPISHLSLGASVRNLGPKMQFVSERYNLPLTLSLGSAYQLLDSLLLTADVHSKPYQDEINFSMGTELVTSSAFTLRAGYIAELASAVSNQQEDESNRGNFANAGGLTGGFGLQFNRFSLDYAITPFGELGNTHTLTLATWFGAPASSHLESAPILLENRIDDLGIIESSLSERDQSRVVVILPMVPAQESWWLRMK